MQEFTAELNNSTQSLVEMVCESLALDLRGARVITEAATGHFALTAVIAALAGARVEAIASDSPFGSSREAAGQTMTLAHEFGLAEKIKIVSRADALFETADIVTNLGHVRPIDREIVSRLQTGAVIPLMYDARELRKSDLDLVACRKKGVRVVGTFEEHPSFNIFRHIGPLALTLISQYADVRPKGCVTLIGSDLFAPYLLESLKSAFASVRHVSSWERLTERQVVETDLFIYSDYCGDLGDVLESADISVLKYSGKKLLLQFSGGVSSFSLRECGWHVIPEYPLPSHRMFHTLAHLGAEPVIELHSCGLKTAEILWKSLTRRDVGNLADLCQIIC